MAKKPSITAIRPAQVKDLPAIMELENRCFSSEAWPEDAMDEYLQKSVRGAGTPLVVAFGRAASNDKETPAGYCLGDMTKPDRGTIISLAVDKEFRGHKLGRKLLDRVCNSLRKAGAHQIVLEVKADNLPAIHLYETAGFQKIRNLRRYYSDGSDAYRMARHYPPEGP